jgi:hypothetical protein
MDSVTFLTRDFDTNASTECPSGYYLDGDGTCKEFDQGATNNVAAGNVRCYYQLYGKYDSSIKSFMRYPYDCVE